MPGIRKGITPHQSTEPAVELTHGGSASSELILYGLIMISQEACQSNLRMRSLRK